LGVDENIRNEVIGISDPIKDLHASVVDVEPLLGITVGGSKVGEIVVRVGPTNGYYQNMYVTHLPLFWTSEGANITKHLADELGLGIYTAVDFGVAMMYIGYTLGPILILAGIYQFVRWHNMNFYPRDGYNYDQQSLINEDNKFITF